MLSYAHGGCETPLLGHTIGEDLERAARDFGDRDALVSCAQDLRYTYAELDAAVDQVARGLLQAGVEKGGRVGIWAPNCAGWVLVQYATAQVGAIPVNIKPAHPSLELSFLLRQSGLRPLFT